MCDQNQCRKCGAVLRDTQELCQTCGMLTQIEALTKEVAKLRSDNERLDRQLQEARARL